MKHSLPPEMRARTHSNLIVVAFGMLLLGVPSLREVIAFPKNKRAVSLLDGSPEKVDESKLEELQIISLAGDLDIGDVDTSEEDL